ncbi:McrC family protein [Alteromonas sp. a30]|uniref:McrC family protein n=1 Tax=Alteromonas sp. a30 TaxID=2730917 RepID=UPI00227E2816|nr:McrC family protein [Alteromonas sp. a30]MCY7295508.1 restriction endonuclease [Alteromonas sp. a30]
MASIGKSSGKGSDKSSLKISSKARNQSAPFAKSNSKTISDVTLYEYDYVSTDEKAKQSISVGNKKVHWISNSAFEYLKKRCLSEQSESRFLQLRLSRGMEMLQVQNYAGVVLCPDATQIEILPKVARHNAQEDASVLARKSLLKMLQSLKQFRHIKTNSANINQQKMPLLEIFISQFLNSVKELVKKGIKHDYQRQQSNNTFLKGKLLHAKQLKHNFIHRYKFYVEFNNYVADRVENKLLHSALKTVASYTRLNSNKRLVHELLFAFDGIELSQDYQQDFDAITPQRGMQHYQVPLSWAKLILFGFSPQTMLGEHHAFSLLFPMEAIFESFVAQHLKQILPKTLTLSTQVQKHHLVSFDGQGYFRLKPDLYLTGLESSLENNPENGLKNDKVILDTKWKLINSDKTSRKGKFGLAQSDFYQMLGYGYKYLNGVGKMVLIYPKTSQFDAPLIHDFYYDEARQLSLKVVPFDISHDCSERIDIKALLGVVIGEHKT